MTDEQAARETARSLLAEQCYGLIHTVSQYHDKNLQIITTTLTAFAAQVQCEEREACAKVVDEEVSAWRTRGQEAAAGSLHWAMQGEICMDLQRIAAAIRSREGK